ncbi:MAG: hypothetical protein AB1656_06590 [Candidatus Omnitrophota bacterium]
MKRIGFSLGVMVAMAVAFAGTCFSQTVDFVHYARYDNPPAQADYIVKVTEEITSVERLVYTKDYPFNGTTSLKVERLEGTAAPDKSLNANFFRYDDENLYVVASIVNDSVYGKMEILLNPYVSVPRFAAAGVTFSGTAETLVHIGPIPALVTVTVSYFFAGLETVEVPLGRFENALKAETSKTISLGDLEMAAIRTTEWYHPLAGLIKSYGMDSKKTAELQEIAPPLESPSGIGEWRHMEAVIPSGASASKANSHP